MVRDIGKTSLIVCNYHEQFAMLKNKFTCVSIVQVLVVLGLLTIISGCNGQESILRVPASSDTLKINGTTAPLEFPDDESVLRSNSTLIQALEATTRTHSSIDADRTKISNTEIDDLNHRIFDDGNTVDDDSKANEVPADAVLNTDRPQTIEDLARIVFTNETFKITGERKQDVELIQNGREDVIDAGKRNGSSGNRVVGNSVGDKQTNFAAINNDGQDGNGIPNLAYTGHATAIVASVFVLFCVSGYVGLMLWRRYLERQYGNREMLVNEEFYDPSDMKHFSI